MKTIDGPEEKFIRRICNPAITLRGSNKSLDEPTSIVSVTAYQLLNKKQGDVIVGYDTEKSSQPFCYEKLIILAVDHNIVLAKLVEMKDYVEEVNIKTIEFIL